MSLVEHKEEGFSLFHLFGVVSGTMEPLLACRLTCCRSTEYFGLPLGIFEKLKFCYNQKKEEITLLHRHIYVTCKPEKQLFRCSQFSLNPCKISRKSYL